MIAAALLAATAGCPRDTMVDLELTQRLMDLEEAMIHIDQENAELITRLNDLEARLARQDTLMRRMAGTIDAVVAELERR